jgi:ABC-type sugar transport system permease subunit
MIKYNYLERFQNPNKKTKGERVNILNFEPTTHLSMRLKKSKFFTMSNEKEINNGKKQGLNINIYRKKINDSNNSKDKLSLNSFNRLTNSTKYLKFRLSKQDKKNKKDKTNTKIENQYFMIQISANNSKNNKPPESKFYLTNYDFEEALQYDKRTFWGIYYICLLAKENILNMLYIKSPLELKSLRLCVFVFMYSCDLTFNTLFYFNSNISDRYHYEGKSLFWFSLLNNMAITIISSILSFLLSITLNFLTNSKEAIEEIFRKEEKKMRKNSKYIVSRITKKEIMFQIYEIIKKLKIKILFFIILECTLLLFFFYFVTAFCEVYQKTQVSWLCDSFTSFILSFPIEFLLAFVIALLYKISLAKKSRLLYKIVIVFYNLS